MKKIKMYDFLSSKEGIYISYLIKEVDKNESIWKSTYESRDKKLTLLLNEDLLIVSENVAEHYKSIKNKINDLDFVSSDIIKNMDALVEELDKTVQYTEYVTDKIKECECQDIKE
jgi:hypothetical protein